MSDAEENALLRYLGGQVGGLENFGYVTPPSHHHPTTTDYVLIFVSDRYEMLVRSTTRATMDDIKQELLGEVRSVAEVIKTVDHLRVYSV